MTRGSGSTVGAIEQYYFLSKNVADVEVLLPEVVTKPGSSSSFSVLVFDAFELELNNSDAKFMPEYFDTSLSVPETEISLSTGWAVTLGRVDRADGHGYCFAIHVEDRCILGQVPPSVSLNTLAGWLSDLKITASGIDVVTG